MQISETWKYWIMMIWVWLIQMVQNLKEILSNLFLLTNIMEMLLFWAEKYYKNYQIKLWNTWSWQNNHQNLQEVYYIFIIRNEIKLILNALVIESINTISITLITIRLTIIIITNSTTIVSIIITALIVEFLIVITIPSSNSIFCN